jgi:hypothetical protein
VVGLFLVLEQLWTGQRHVLIFPRHAFHVCGGIADRAGMLDAGLSQIACDGSAGDHYTTAYHVEAMA